MWHNLNALNRATRFLWLMTVALIAGYLVVWLAQQPVFAIRAIDLEGSNQALRHVTLPSVRLALANISANAQPGSPAQNGLYGTFFTVNLDMVRHAFETVPWVRHATVRRQWPNRLLITLEEHKPLAFWNDGRLVNTEGELFTANLAEAEEEGDLPEFSGPSGTELLVTRRYRQLNHWLAPLNNQLASLTLTPRFSWQLLTYSGLKVQLGRNHSDADLLANNGLLEADKGADKEADNVSLRPEESKKSDASTLELVQLPSLETRVQRFVAVLPTVEARLGRTIEQADLRYANGFALRPQGGSLLAVPEQPASHQAKKSL